MSLEAPCQCAQFGDFSQACHVLGGLLDAGLRRAVRLLQWTPTMIVAITFGVCCYQSESLEYYGIEECVGGGGLAYTTGPLVVASKCTR